jgi:hypothetical protein
VRHQVELEKSDDSGKKKLPMALAQMLQLWVSGTVLNEIITKL